MSSLQLHLQLVHPWAVDRSLWSDPRGACSTHTLSAEMGALINNLKAATPSPHKPHAQSKLTNIFHRNKSQNKPMWSVASLRQPYLHPHQQHWLKCLIHLSNSSQGWPLTGNYRRVASSHPTRVQLTFFPFLQNAHFHCSSVSSALLGQCRNWERMMKYCRTLQPNVFHHLIQMQEDECFFEKHLNTQKVILLSNNRLKCDSWSTDINHICTWMHKKFLFFVIYWTSSISTQTQKTLKDFWTQRLRTTTKRL